MKKDIRIVIFLVGMILLVILCVYRVLADKEIEEEITEGYDITNIPTPRTIVDPVDGKELTGIGYYKVNLQKMSTESVEAAIGSNVEITPDIITDYVCDALEDEELTVTVNGTSVKNNMCTVDLKEDIIALTKEYPEIEKLILDAFAMSILDNCRDIDAVSFTIMGKEYSTQNIKIENGKAYIKR